MADSSVRPSPTKKGIKIPSLNGTVLSVALQTKESAQQVFGSDVADGVGIRFKPQLFEQPRPIGADGLHAQGKLRAHFLDTFS